MEDDRKERGVVAKGNMTDEEKARNVVYIYQVPLKVETPTRLNELIKLYNMGPYYEEKDYKNFLFGGGFSITIKRGFDHAMLDKGQHMGKYKGPGITPLVRDENYPIRLTLQYYYVTDTVDISETLMKSIYDQLEMSYTHGKDKSSLVSSQTSRPTEPKNLSKVNPDIHTLSGCI